MARSSDINQRVVLSGAEEVRRGLEQIAQAGERSGNQIRQTLLAATSGTSAFTAGAKASGAASRQMGAALTQLSFQANDVATSLASGISPLQTLAQQGGQFVQVFQQGGGLGPVLRAAGAAIASFVTPTTAAVAGIAAVGAAFAVLIARASNAQAAAKQFDVILRATGRSGGTTGKELEAAAENLHDVGLSASEARDSFKKFLGEGGLPDQAALVTRVGAELNKVLGEGSLERFRSAAAQGGPALEDFARKVGIVVTDTAAASRELKAAAEAAKKFNDAINDALQGRAGSLADAARDAARQVEDLDRQRDRQSRQTGDPAVDAARQRAAQLEDIETQSARRIEDINRQHAQTINNIITQRNQANAAALAAYNQQIQAAAQAALDKTSLIQQIADKVFGSFKGSLTPLQETVNTFITKWNALLDTLAQSEVIQGLIRDIGEMVRSITAAIEAADKLANALKQVPGLPAVLGGSGSAPQGRAAGGLVRGPGTGTSDSVPAWLSNGEFIVRAAAARVNLPLLHAINSLNAPLVPRSRMPRSFAGGGLVGAGANATGSGKTPFNIILDGQSFGAIADDAVATALLRVARNRSMLSGGRPQSWKRS